MKTAILEVIAASLAISALAAIPVGCWHTATYNSPGILAGFLGAIVLGFLAAIVAQIAD